MRATEQDVLELFSLIDGLRPHPEVFTRQVLERILYVVPECGRAQALLEELDFGPSPDPLTATIEEAEELAARGLGHGARALADEVRRLYPSHPVAQAWLDGIHLLLDS